MGGDRWAVKVGDDRSVVIGGQWEVVIDGLALMKQNLKGNSV